MKRQLPQNKNKGHKQITKKFMQMAFKEWDIAF